MLDQQSASSTDIFSSKNSEYTTGDTKDK